MSDTDRQQPGDPTGEISVIGRGIEITGNIEASVDLHLEGKVTGDVRCATLILGEDAVIRGNVYARSIRASGTIEGSLEARDLAVEATARLSGDITYSRMRVANGAIVDGKMIHRASEEGEGEGHGLRLVEPVRGRASRTEAVHIE